MSTTEGKGRLRRWPVVAATTVVGAAVAAVAVALRSPLPAGPDPAAPPTATAPVVRGNAVERVQITGVLGFAGSFTVVHQGPAGIVTSVPAPGTVVQPGEACYAVANQPVRLLAGTVPAYRELGAGVPDGPDVRQLEQNLTALGLDPQHRITVDDTFTAATSAAVRAWQARWGWPSHRRTGRLPLGSVVFLPGPARIADVPAATGVTIAADAPVFTATSTTRVVTAPITADRQYLVRPGDRVVVMLPGLAALDGTVTGIGPVVVPSAQEGTQPTPTAPVTVDVTVPAGAPELNRASAQVAITTETRTGVLLVPVGALLARPGGGYRLRRSDGTFVDVRPGLFDDVTGMVEVIGEGLAEGQTVQVPAS